MPISRGLPALDLVGMPHAHGHSFQAVANDTDCVIMCRELGEVCTQLVEEGYDSKGFRVHGKSCDWGPMAGFVCRDPRLSKKGLPGAKYNEEEHETALHDRNGAGWFGSMTQLYISPARRDWLVENNKITLRDSWMDAAGGGRWVKAQRGLARHESGIEFNYVLVPGAVNGDQVLGIYLDNGKNKQFKQKGWGAPRPALEPLLGMVNPQPAWPDGHYKNAVTGDYDLFAIWPKRRRYDPLGEDRRTVGMGPSDHYWKRRDDGIFKQKDRRDEYIERHEDKLLGNISPRGHMIAQLLNSHMALNAGFAQRLMVHHSDEGGRPYVSEVDKPLVGFIPLGVTAYGLPEIAEIRQFVQTCRDKGYQILLNKGWVAQLGHLGGTGLWRGPTRQLERDFLIDRNRFPR